MQIWYNSNPFINSHVLKILCIQSTRCSTKKVVLYMSIQSFYLSVFWRELAGQHVQIIVCPLPGVHGEEAKCPYGSMKAIVDFHHSEKQKTKITTHKFYITY